MRNLLALIGLLVVGGAGVGWYMGWYKLSFTRTDDGTLQIKADVDTKKAGAEISDGFKNLATAVGNQAEKTTKDAHATPPNGTPGSIPGPLTPVQGSPIESPMPVTPQPPMPQKPTPVLPRGTILPIPQK